MKNAEPYLKGDGGVVGDIDFAVNVVNFHWKGLGKVHFFTYSSEQRLGHKPLASEIKLAESRRQSTLKTMSGREFD